MNDVIFEKEPITLPDEDALRKEKERILWILGGYGITPSYTESYPGPRYSLFELGIEPKHLSKFIRYEKDILSSFGNLGCRIINPLPDKLGVGLEIPNNQTADVEISSYCVFSSKQFADSGALLPLAFGIDSRNECIVKDLANLSHILVCGGTQQGKTSLLYQLIMSLLLKSDSDCFKLAIVSDSDLEFQEIAMLPEEYFIEAEGKSGVISNRPDAHSLLNGLIMEMEQRRKLFKLANARNVEEYNTQFEGMKLNPAQGHHPLPHLICVIDEIQPFFQGDAWNDILTKAFELSINTGVHFIFSTRYTSTSTLTPLLRTHIPNRISFNIRLANESRLVLGNNDATRLMDLGDAIFNVNGKSHRCQIAKPDSEGVMSILKNIEEKNSSGCAYILPEPSDIDSNPQQSAGLISDRDPLLEEAARRVVQAGTAATSSIQRVYGIGYNRAGKILDQLEALGIVGPSCGGKPRAVLVDPMQLENILQSI